MRMIVLLSAAVLSACAPGGEAPGTDPVAGASGTAATGERYDLRGQWTVSKIDGETLSPGIPFTGGTDALVWQPACAGQDIRYRTLGDGIEFYQPPRDDAQSVCEIGYPPALPRVIDALEGSWDVEALDNGNLVLTRAERRIELEKTAVAQISLAGEWRVAGIDGQEFDEPYGLALSADESEIWWAPRCAGQSVRYRIEDERFVVVAPAPVAPLPAGSQAPPPPAVCAIGLPPRLPEVMDAIRSATRIERTQANGIRLSGEDGSVTLFSQ